ncbi:MAG: hypothetical protein ACRDS9_18375, partial [Pseudonocardiaceae bacterium]
MPALFTAEPGLVSRIAHRSRAAGIESDGCRGGSVEVREELATVEWPLGQGLIHGDAWAGTLLWASDIAHGRDGVVP